MAAVAVVVVLGVRVGVGGVVVAKYDYHGDSWQLADTWTMQEQLN